MTSSNQSASFARRLDELPKVLDWVEGFTRSCELDSRLGHDLLLVVEELFTNQVRHQPQSEAALRLELRSDGPTEVVTVLVDPHAQHFDLREADAPKLDIPGSERTPGGLGVHLIRNLASKLDYEYEDGVATITICLDQREA